MCSMKVVMCVECEGGECVQCEGNHMHMHGIKHICLKRGTWFDSRICHQLEAVIIQAQRLHRPQSKEGSPRRLNITTSGVYG